ncbi:LytTR family DNA-binding domain-containing protein [Maribacter sp. 2307ULW6-5]|uniref:LytTR family DNA-binding domain-containing protein n=1 Tax=Maribacter sp. 2307ULW6-5 TaxID=3386275 RepID=UPI0039BCE187
MDNIATFFRQEIAFFALPKNKLMLIGFLMLFVLTFLVVYAPFNMDNWDKRLFLGYALVGGLAMLLSHFVIRPLFGLAVLTNLSLVLWCMFDVFLITFGLYLAFSPSFPTLAEKAAEYQLTWRYVALVVPGPYLFFVWILGMRNKMSSYSKLEIASAFTPDPGQDTLLRFKTENDKVVLAIDYAELRFIKSSGNYLEIHYLKGKLPVRELVRMRLKEVEANIAHPAIVRVHRSFLVHTGHISSFQKTSKGYTLIMRDIPDLVIPVSSGHKALFEKKMAIHPAH